ncbi:hypothetical protein IZU27_11520 [Treponema socranskii]|uniref:hypothetical protein n=1 Tax=Treponema socranskii TaxID=53419 RepID=UPI003D8FA88A
MNRIDGSAKRTVFVRAHIAPLFPEALPRVKCAPLVQHTLFFSASDLCAAETDPLYEPYNQLSGNKKSFHLSEYLFSSNIKKLFFDINLFYDASIEHIWYTGMQTRPLFETPGLTYTDVGTADFFVPYRDFDTRARCLYRPDFVIETKQRRFYIVEIADGRTVNRRIVRAKREYVESANENADGTRIEYVYIPSRRADMRFEKFIAAYGVGASSSLCK